MSVDLNLQQNKRDSSVEFLRIILMFFIIVHHLIVKQGLVDLVTETYVNDVKTPFLFLINSFVVVGVNTFVFISGYYGVRFKFNRFLSLIAQAVFLGTALYLAAVLLGFANFYILNFINSFFLIYTTWWFLSVYLALYIIAPILNKGLKQLDKKQHLIIITLLLLICNVNFLKFGNTVTQAGYTLASFIIIYIIADFCRKYIKHIKMSGLLYVLSCISIFVLSYVLFLSGRQLTSWSLFYYNNPILIAAAIFIFYFFKNKKIKNNFINKIAHYVFGVYLFHEHPNVIAIILPVKSAIGLEIENTALYFISIFVLCVIIFILGTIIDYLREIILTPILNFIFETKVMKRLNIR